MPVLWCRNMSRIKRYKVFLSTFNNLPKSIQKTIIKNSDKDLVKLICEICLNISCNNISISNHKKTFSKETHEGD